MNTDLRDTLLELCQRDERMRAQLAANGELYRGYHPEMERVHRENAEVLEQIVREHGWPGLKLVGRGGAEASWIVAQHAIGLPPFQRQCAALMAGAVEQGEAEAKHLAMLEDRICFNERRPQRYGSQFDWDEDGEMSPWPIEEEGGVEARRARVGLPPLEDAIRSIRESCSRESARPPKNYAERQTEIETWARRVGWLETEG